MKKTMGMAFVVLICLFATVTWGAETWRIGTIFPVTGPLSKNGMKNFDGVKIATAMVNDQGGVLGKKIELVSADAPDPQAAASEANRLITNDKITCLIGTQASSLSMAATVVAEKNKVFYLENEGVSGLITARGFKYLVRTTFSGSMMATQMVDYTANVLAPVKFKKDAKELRLAIIHEDGGFGTSSAKSLSQRANELGLNVVATESYSAKTADLSGLILKLKREKPDVVLAAQYINDSILFHRQAKEYRFQTLVFGTTAGQGNPDFIKAIGDDANGVLAGGIPSEISIKGLGDKQRQEAEEFVRRYQESHNGEYPNPTSFVGFAGAWILYKYILPEAGSLDPDKLREAAGKLDLKPGDGVLNWGIKFAPDGKIMGQNIYSSAGINQWQNGQIRLIYPKEIASSELQ